MSFVARELARLHDALCADEDNGALRAAQQALAWSLEPTGFMPPGDMLLGTVAGSEDCSSPFRLPPS